MKALGKCDFPNCDEIAVWECGEIYDHGLKKTRIARWCDEHCPRTVKERGKQK